MLRSDNSPRLLFTARANIPDPVLDRLHSFSKLPCGWHFGEGAPIDSSLLKQAVQVVYQLRTVGAVAVEVFPRVDGSVVVSGINDDETLDITCHLNNQFDIYHEANDHDLIDDEGCTHEQLAEYLRTLKWKSIKFYGSSIHNITVTSDHGLIALLSSPQPMVLRLSMQDAPQNTPIPNAIIADNSMKKEYEVTHPYS